MNKPKWLELLYLAVFFLPPGIATGLCLRMLNVRFNIAGVLFFVAIATVIMLVWIAMFVACSHWLSKNTKNA